MRLLSNPSRVSVWVNRFDWGQKQSLLLPTGAQYYLRMSAPGYFPLEQWVSCSRPGKKELIVKLRRGDAGHEELLMDPPNRARDSILTYCLVERVKGRFRLFLFTPGLALDEISLSKPIKVADILEGPTRFTLPIASDEFAVLAQKHGLTNGGFPKPNVLGAAGGLGRLIEVSSKRSSWYNDWKVWAVVGVIAGGVVVGYLASGRQTVLGSQSRPHPRGIKLRID